jgi:gluconate 5-dehydrogenase
MEHLHDPIADDARRPADWLGLSDARVLVAGAGGLGSACAWAFLAARARVDLVDADQERARTALSGTPPDRAVASGADLTDPVEVKRVVDGVCSRWGGIDVCVHAVGTNDRKPVLATEAQEWARTIEVNLTTAWLLGQDAGRRMVGQGQGRIVFFSSVSGLLAHKDHAPYAASKGAINQMMRVMAAEWAAHGVTVNAVAPGYVETRLTRGYLETDGNRQRLESLVPAGRLGTPAEVTGPVLFLSSPQARFVTGHVLYVDGGRTLV